MLLSSEWKSQGEANNIGLRHKLLPT